ncbi:CPBP family intramembrane glutamic endopeptidase [Leptospira johnsonii]|uniref:CAAX protease self-immunity n=1 Tax=Leptospira johnsonii TaxID=1917820 RepID=A0A2P2D3V5_9LEPT|nr:CPBP family intramembrane glutamic endopeptidase [Leptospira johnsonii]GBF39333.1 CAAX protease self-immunity [Leptospira johnsonii]
MKSIDKTWLNLILAPTWFLIVISVFAVYYSYTGIQANEIELKVSFQTPLIILIVQLLIFATLLSSTRHESFHLFKDAWINSDWKIQSLIGIVTGCIIAGLYIYLLSPARIYLQNTLGDYIPAGETAEVFGKQIYIFFIANVLLAPYIEENLYRNFALSNLLHNYGRLKSVLLTSLFFGLLHWTGGFWYMLMTAMFVGIPFAFLTIQSQSIVCAFVSHLTLNVIEFAYVLHLNV